MEVDGDDNVVFVVRDEGDVAEVGTLASFPLIRLVFVQLIFMISYLLTISIEVGLSRL